MQKQDNFAIKLYKLKNTVFTMDELGLLFPEIQRENLRVRVNYYVNNNALRNVRKGIYVKTDYNTLELAIKIYTPSYISLETVLKEHGVIFQYYKTIFVVSYLTRSIKVDNNTIQYRKIKGNILLDKRGVEQKDNYAIATKERAFLDALYLYKDYHFDNLDALDRKEVFNLLDIYQSKSLNKKVKQIFKYA